MKYKSTAQKNGRLLKPPIVGIVLHVSYFQTPELRFGQSQTAQEFELVKFLRLTSGCKFCTLYTRTPLGMNQIAMPTPAEVGEKNLTKMDLI